MQRHDQLNFRNSLQRLMEHGDPGEIEGIAARQERTVDALLRRLFSTNESERREMAILADEVGLGKTFVAMGVVWSVLLNRIATGQPPKPVLIVTPSSQALFNKWQRDLETFQKDVASKVSTVRVTAVATPLELVEAMSSPFHSIVLARESALDGKHRYEDAMSATLHFLFHFRPPGLDVDQRLRLVCDFSNMQERSSVMLGRSRTLWAQASSSNIGFDRYVRRAVRRLGRVSPEVLRVIDESMKRVQKGGERLFNFASRVRDLTRAAMAQQIPGRLPLVIVDEIHNWKNQTLARQRFMHMFGGRVERLLGLSATPFQLGSHELINLLDLRLCLHLEEDRQTFLDAHVRTLQQRLECAQDAGTNLAQAWSHVLAKDIADITSAWLKRKEGGKPSDQPSRIEHAVQAASAVEAAHSNLMESLRPFVVRHRRDTRHRRWRVGRDADAPLDDDKRWSRSLAWRPGLDVSGDGELVHYLMMRAVQESKNAKGATSLGADLGGSYDFFREHELKRLKALKVPAATPYVDLVERATHDPRGEAHPKVRVTTERAFNAWLQGEKTLIFCFNPLTVEALRRAIDERIRQHQQVTLTAAFDCAADEYERRLQNFQKRLYDYHQSLFLLFQDHPLAGREGRVPSRLALAEADLAQIARKLAAGGTPKDRSRFDRRRVLAATEQVLVARWMSEPQGLAWLQEALSGDELSRQRLLERIRSPEWPRLRRTELEGVQREAEPEPFPDDDDQSETASESSPANERAWRELLQSRAGQAVLAPYLADAGEVPSLLTRWHAEALHALPAKLRVLATRMLRRMVRSPGFLTRFLLNDPTQGPALSKSDDESDGHWADKLHERWSTPPAGGESAEQRFNAYLETLLKVVGHEKGIESYEASARNRDMVTRVTGGVTNADRDRLFTGFNTPLVPEILIVTSVGQEGIDLHRECRHVIHHDLPWNPATLEQRTGRVDRIGSKAERLAGFGGEAGCLDVVVPYIANTYDEFRFRRVHARAHLFEVTMGSAYEVDTAGQRGNDDQEPVRDDLNKNDGADASVPLPEPIAEALRIRLEAE